MKKRLFLKINIELFFFFNVSKCKYFPWQKKEKINSKTKVKFNGWHIWLFQIQKNCPDLETFNWNFSSVLVGVHKFDDNKCFLFQMKVNFLDPWSTIVKHSFSDYGTLISFPGGKKKDYNLRSRSCTCRSPLLCWIPRNRGSDSKQKSLWDSWVRPHCFKGAFLSVGMGYQWVAISFYRIFLTQGSNLHLLLGRQVLYHWVTLGKPPKEVSWPWKHLITISLHSRDPYKTL